jgi:mannitol/fructose-specific phosphotransferase system IIA component (Ntr-type)
MLNLKQAAQHAHVDENELRHFAQRGGVEAVEHGGDWLFDCRALDEWAQRNLLSAGGKELKRQHGVIMDGYRREHRQGWGVAGFLCAEAIDLALTAKAKGGILRDMTDLAARSGLVYDHEQLFRELVAREEAASTAIGMEVALLHPRFHDPYLFETSFIAYGRSERPIFFGAPNGEATRHFFLICAADHELHLHILARLAVMAHATEFLTILDEVPDAEQALAVIRAAEEGLLA